jgi:CRP-like cAMP-binding protein
MRAGNLQKFKKGQVIYSLDFEEEFYMVNKGYVIRYLVQDKDSRSVQSLYGPGYFFPLTPLYRTLMNYNLNEKYAHYMYEAVTDAEIYAISNAKLVKAIEKNMGIYGDVLYEAGKRFKSNIQRLENTALSSTAKKIAHLLAYLADEFGVADRDGIKVSCELPFPLSSKDLSEHLNIPADKVQKAVDKMQARGQIQIKKDTIVIPDMDMLKDVYL